MLKLHYAPDSCSLAIHIALAESGAEYELLKVDFSQQAQISAAYLAINPKGKVPALVTERGVLTETPAILSFVAQCFPQARLAPLNDPWQLARLQAFNTYLCSTVHVAHAHRMRGRRWADEPSAIEEMARKAPQVVLACFELIEATMFEGPWVFGDAYTIADAYLFTLSQWWEADGVDARRLPRLAEHRLRVRERPAVQRALAAERG
jgi:glutathione S-transferase